MNIKGHFETITRHKLLVMKYCFACGLYEQGLAHDLSKYSPTEFIPGCIYYQGDHSPNEAEREAKGYTSAWLHHKGRNKHHLEYWIDYSTTKTGLTGMKIPLRYVCEMVCDRVAASQIYLGDKYTDAAAWNYYEHSKDHYLLHPETRALLEKLLKMVRDIGQERTFAYMKYLLGCEKDYWERQDSASSKSFTKICAHSPLTGTRCTGILKVAWKLSELCENEKQRNRIRLF